MNLYRQSIALFGIVLPILASIVLIAICFFLKSKVIESFDNKQTLFKAYQVNSLKVLDTEDKIIKQRQFIDRWNE